MRNNGLRGRGAAVVAIAATALLVMAGCSSSNGDGGTPTLTQFYHQYGEDGVQEGVQEWAAAYTPATIDVQWVTGDYAKKVTSLLQSGKGIDIFENNAIDVQSARQGQYLDLTDLIAPIADQYSEVALKPVMVDGKYYGVPMIVDSQLFLYRKSMFEAAGITTPPATWDELVADIKKLTTSDHKGAFLGNDGGAGVIANIAPAASGAGLLNEDSTEVTFNNAAVAQALTDVHELYAGGNLLTGAATDWWDPTAFIAGDAAITWQGLWAVPKILEELGDDVGAFAVPAIGSNGVPAVTVSQWNEQIAAKSPNTDAAKAAVKAQWITDTAWQQQFAVGYGFHIPPITATAASTEQLQSGLPKTIVDLTAASGYTAGPFWTPAMVTALSDAATNIVANGANAADELAKAQATAQGLLDALNK